MSDEQLTTEKAEQAIVAALVNIGFGADDIKVSHNPEQGCMWVSIRVQRVDGIDHYIPCCVIYRSMLESEANEVATRIRDHIDALRRF